MLETKGILVAVIAFLLFGVGLYGEKGNLILVLTSGTQKKRLNIEYFVIFVFFWILGVCVTDSNDIANYEWAYNHRIAHNKEYFFDIIQFFFHDAGWSFEFFKTVWTSVVTILLYRGIKKHSKTPSSTVGLALISVMTAFITQMRSALVGAIFLNAIQLIWSGKRKDRVVYLIIILLCAQIHIMAYSFLIFLFINPEKNVNFKKLYYIVISLITLIALFGSSFFFSTIHSMLSLLLAGGDDTARVLSYFGGEFSQFRYAFFLLIKHLLLFFLTDRACALQIKEIGIVGSEIRKFQMIREANTLMLAFLPITILSAPFERLFDCFSLIQYSMVFNVGKSNIVLFSKYSFNVSLQSVMVAGVLLITFIEWYFSPTDLIRMLNSFELVF